MKDQKTIQNKSYEDMLDLPHHQSSTRPHMSIHDRAAQFAPFSALTGHEEALKKIAEGKN